MIFHTQTQDKWLSAKFMSAAISKLNCSQFDKVSLKQTINFINQNQVA